MLKKLKNIPKGIHREENVMSSTDNYRTGETQLHKEIDLSVMDGLLALRKKGAPDPRMRIINIYIDSAPKLMTTIREAFVAADPTSLKKAAHSLKSSSMNVGANALAALCNDLERCAMDNTLDNAAELINKTEIKFASAMGALREALKDF
jgi:HPt (histidine-containing phosphotransfer) domain-containing protein